MSSLPLPLTFLIASAVKCRKYRKRYQNLSPEIYSLTPDTSKLGDYTLVNITGINFSRTGIMGYSTVNFGNIKNIPITFYSSLNISFVVPVIEVYSTTYTVQVVNNIYPTSSYSNIVEYTLT